jgi:hypothetical protein
MSSQEVLRRVRMPSVVERSSGARHRKFVPTRNIAIALIATALVGCSPAPRGGPLAKSAMAGEPRNVRSAPSIPPSVRALLEPQPAPTCALPANESNVDERQKLDYERQCFRQAEIIVRDRLSRLQSAVGKLDRAN